MNPIRVVVLTGGPGGGKTAFIEELSHDPVWTRRFRALPEAISLMGDLDLSIRDKAFQREMVRLQIAQEDSLLRNINNENQRIILCNRGSLDPLAYWLECGWQEQEFFKYTGTNRQGHYQRYAAVIQLVTAADGAEQAYKRWPEAHRLETPEAAIRIDRLLQQAWGGHRCYFRIDNAGRDWPAKAQKAREILMELYGEV